MEVEEANTEDNQLGPLSLQSTLNLSKDDQVWVQIDTMSSGVQLYDSENNWTYFTGFMLEEENVEAPLWDFLSFLLFLQFVSISQKKTQNKCYDLISNFSYILDDAFKKKRNNYIILFKDLKKEIRSLHLCF